MIVGMETTAQSQPHTEVKYSTEGKGTAVMLGNEVTGINTDIMPYLDCVVEIPMFGAKNSKFLSNCSNDDTEFYKKISTLRIRFECRRLCTCCPIRDIATMELR